MSIDNLFVPNIYDLFCRSITIGTTGATGPTGPAPDSGVVSLNAPLSLQAGSTITTYTVRGVSASLPAVLPVTISTLSSATNNYSQIMIKIPEFSITGLSGATGPAFMQVTLPLIYAPIPAVLTVPCYIAATSSSFVIGIAQISGNGTNCLVQIAKTDLSSLGPGAPFGLNQDICLVYNPN